MEDSPKIKAYIGLITIILSPLIGSLLFKLFSFVISGMFYTDRTIELYWFSCILVVAILGFSVIMITCTEAIIIEFKEFRENKNKS